MPEDVRKLRIAITGGGTGGHVFPAIAVCQRLKADEEIEKIFYIGCAKNMEKDAAKKENLDFYSIDVSGMPRKGFLKIIIWFFQLVKAVFDSLIYLRNLKPDVVFGTGGYVSGAALIAAKLLKIPVVIHDCDAHPGIVSRFFARWAYAVSVSFEQAKDFLESDNISVNGNPIRANFAKVDRENAVAELGLNPEKKIILVMGGSQGAQTINNAILDAAPVLVKEFGYQIIHQTGKKNYDEYIDKFSQKFPDLLNNNIISLTGKEMGDFDFNIIKEDKIVDNQNSAKPEEIIDTIIITDKGSIFNMTGYIVKSFFDNMEIPLNAADIAISRAGSLSISELNLCGLPSILIPYPYAAADHQKFNALAMQQAGASVMLEDSQCTAEKIIELLTDILNDAEKLENMKQANKRLARPDAAENIVRILKDAAAGK